MGDMQFNPTARRSRGATASLSEQRRVVAATVIGATVEWYDFFLYAAAAGLVFGQAFFKPAGEGMGTILSFVTVGISFLFRPLGAVVAGALGDRYGRRIVLVCTLIMMGSSTALIGLLPTYSSIGMAAPILLLLLRVLQGISAGGEWGGAALMAVEHAPANKRGLYGAGPQTGVPCGLLLSSIVLAITARIAPGQAFVDWGWRIPFLLSVILIGIGAWVRRSVEESPVFAEINQRAQETRAPLKTVFKNHMPLVLVAAFIVAGNAAPGYMTAGGFIQGYATKGPLHLERSAVLWAVAGSGLTWLLATVFAGWLSDRIGRRGTFIVGFILQLLILFTLFPLVNRGTIASLFLGLALLSVPLGLTYGPLAALYTEMFPASVRFSGVSLTYALGVIIGGAFTPLISQMLMDRFHNGQAVAAYLAVITTLGLAAVVMTKDRSGIPLGPDHEAAQQVSPLRGLSKA